MAVMFVILVTILLGELIAYVIHRLSHWPGAGRLYQNHLVHHVKLYPSHRFTSDTYQSDLKASLIVWFTPICVLFALIAFFFLSLMLWFVFVGTVITVAFLNNYMHDSYHIRKHWLYRFSWHRKLRYMHMIHHKRVQNNFGIYSFGIDRMLKTLRRKP